MLTVETTDELQRLFVHLFPKESSRHYEFRTMARANGKAEVRLEARGEKSHLPVEPVLHPSRYLLSGHARSPDSLLLAAHVPDALAGDLREEGISHADLNGRLFIAAPGILLDRRPWGHQYRNPTSEVDLFALKTSRIVRAFLSHRDREWTQNELENHTNVSRGLISRVLKELVQARLVKRMEREPRTPAAYQLVEFDRLLNEWKAADRSWEKHSIQQISLLKDDVNDIASTVRDALGAEQVAFTQWFAAYLRHPYTTPPLVSVYLRSRRLLEIPLGRKVSTGGNLWLILPADEGVLFDTQSVKKFTLVSDVQVYLDLLRVGQRGPDQAEALRAWEGFAR